MPEAEIELAADPVSVAAARRFVGDFLRDIGGDDDWAAVQIVSELATNAIVHAGTSFVVRVAVSAELIRLEVTDRNPELRAVQRHYSDDATTGRGLGMLEMIADSWGVDNRPGSKTVWCELVRADLTVRPDDDEDAPPPLGIPAAKAKSKAAAPTPVAAPVAKTAAPPTPRQALAA